MAGKASALEAQFQIINRQLELLASFAQKVEGFDFSKLQGFIDVLNQLKSGQFVSSSPLQILKDFDAMREKAGLLTSNLKEMYAVLKQVTQARYEQGKFPGFDAGAQQGQLGWRRAVDQFRFVRDEHAAPDWQERAGYGPAKVVQRMRNQFVGQEGIQRATAFREGGGIQGNAAHIEKFLDWELKLRQTRQENVNLSKEDLDVINRRLQAIISTVAVEERIGPAGGKRTASQLKDEQAMNLGSFAGGKGTLPAAWQQMPGGERAVRNVADAMKSWGLATDKVSVSIDHNAKLVRWTTSQYDANLKAMRTATVTTNEYGQILNTTQNRLRTFGSAIIRDVGEMAKWAIAATLIYAPLRELNKMIQESIQIQEKLVDVQVSLGVSSAKMGDIFSAAQAVGSQYGVSLNKVVEGMVQAYRATGNLATVEDRTRVATALLGDAMTLARLSGMDQAKAIDTLVGALRQANIPLDQGTVILDKWVAVSKKANVNLQTLSESFAIVATAASDAGIDVDKLNGIIAALAEVTTLSAEETGNAVRGIIAGFQKPEVITALSKYGIGVRDLNGELEDFTVIIEKIVSRKSAGILSEKDLAQISNIIGGGYRRGAQVSAFLQNYDRANQLAAVSANANGDAAEAMAVKMETLQTALTKLQNAFTGLAKTFGFEGGFLEVATQAVDLLTGIVTVFDKIIQVVGKTTTAMATLTAAIVIFKHSAALQNWMGSSLFGGKLGAPAPGGMPGTSGFTPFAGGVTPKGILSAGGGAVGGALGGLAVSALSGDVGKIIEGDQQALARSGATIAGGAIGAFLSGGSPIGILIGSQAAQTMLQDLTSDKADFVALFEEINAAAPGAPTVKPTQESLSEETATFLQDKIDRTSNVLISVIAFLGKRDLTQSLAEKGVSLTMLQASARRIPIGEAFAGAGVGGVEAFIRGGDPKVRKEALELIKQWEEVLKEEAEKKNTSPDLTTAFGQRYAATLSASGSLIRSFAKSGINEQFAALGKGQITTSAFKDFKERAQAAEESVIELYTALGSSANAVLGVTNTTDALKVLTDLALGLSGDEFLSLVESANAVETAQNALEKYRKEGITDTLVLIELTENLTTAQREYNEATAVAKQGAAYKKYEIPGLVNVAPGITPAQLQAVIDQEVRPQSLARAKEMTPDPDEQQKIIDSYGDVAFQAGDNFKLILGEQAGLAPDILEAALAKFHYDFKASQFGIQEAEIPEGVTQAQMQGRVNAWAQFLAQKFPEYEQDTANQEGILDSTNRQTLILHGDNLAISLALKDIKNLQEKQLEGVFNLPADMAALVPMTGQLYFSTSPIAQNGGTSLGPLPEAADNLNTASSNLNEAAGVMINAFRPEGAAGGPQEGPLTIPTSNYSPESTFDAGTPRPRGDLSSIIAQNLIDWEIEQTRLGEEWARLVEATPDKMPIGSPDKMPIGRYDPLPTPDAGGAIGDAISGFFRWLQEVMGGNPIYGGAGAGIGAGNSGLGTSAGTGGLGVAGAGAANMPMSIPITTKINIENQNIIYLDGSKILDQLNKRSLVDFQKAKRSAGAVAYDVSA